jgi:pantothenate kinase type III
MQGLITLDLGNSHPHAGLFTKSGSEWKLNEVIPINNLESSLAQMGLNPHNSQIAISKVKSYSEIEKELFEKGFLMTSTLDHWKGKRFFGLPVNYTESIGQDRLIQAFYAYRRKLPTTLLIDAGTFTTLDIISQDGLLGGYIIPGFEDYFSLFQKGENLQHYQEHFKHISSLPHSTEDALVGGYEAFVSLVEKLIHSHEVKNIIITGGKSAVWENFLSEFSNIIELSPHHIHLALHHWWTTQIELL